MTPGTSTPWGPVAAVSAVAALVGLSVFGLLVLADRRRKIPVDVARGLGVVAATWGSLVLGYWLEGQVWFGGGFQNGISIVSGDDALFRFLKASSADYQERRWLLVVLGTIAGLLLVRRGKNASRAGRAPAYDWHRRWLREGLLVWFTTLPVQVTLLAAGVVSWLTWAGVAVAAAGAVLAWLERPAGLALLGWGTWLVSADAWPGVLTVLSPVLVTWWLLGRPRAGAATVRGPVGDS